jgi:hypothetical protein
MEEQLVEDEVDELLLREQRVIVGKCRLSGQASLA